MIGELITSDVDEKTGLRFYVGARYRIGGGQDPIIGFNLADPNVITAIHQRSNAHIYEILVRMIGQAHLVLEIPDTIHAMGLGWEYHRDGGVSHLASYMVRLERLIDNPFCGADDRDRANAELQAIRKSKAQYEAKARISRRRRSDFQSKRDQLMLALIERDGYECAECGEVEGLTIDHIMPLSKGGSDELDNLQLLCKKHNSSKGDSMP